MLHTKGTIEKYGESREVDELHCYINQRILKWTKFLIRQDLAHERGDKVVKSILIFPPNYTSLKHIPITELLLSVLLFSL